jgi:hypothetical protein
MAEARAIADYNRQHFFSQAFSDLVADELKTNLATAFDQLSKCNNYQPWLTQWTKLLQYPSVTDFLQNNTVSPTRSDVDSIIQVAETKL